MNLGRFVVLHDRLFHGGLTRFGRGGTFRSVLHDRLFHGGLTLLYVYCD